MQISFFEEFPTKESLAKLSLVKRPIKLYLAAKSLDEFNKLSTSINSKKVREIVYWPILEKKEGYWFSPFTRRKAILRIFDQLRNKKIPLMLDLELPTTRNPLLYLTQSLNFFRNKRSIKNFIENYGGDVYLAEYYTYGMKMKFLGLHYDNAQVIKMLYSSVHKFKDEFIRKEFAKGKEKFGDKFIAGLGTIALGVGGNEPILSLEMLKRDLKLAEKVGVKEVIIFRLGGLNKKHLPFITKSAVSRGKGNHRNSSELVRPSGRHRK